MPPPNPMYPFVKVKCRHYSCDWVRQMSGKWHPSINFSTWSIWKHTLTSKVKNTRLQSCHRNDLLRWKRKIKITKRTLFFFQVCFQSAERKPIIQHNLRYGQSLPDIYILWAFHPFTEVLVIWLEICEPVNHYLFKGRNNIWVWK